MDNEMSEETIQRQMQDTRASLSEKLETLEQKVMGTVESATTAVTDTVDAIKESVQDTVASVQEGVKSSVDTVKDIFDVPAHVQQHPWVMVGGSVAVGYCLGALLTPSSQSQYAPAPTSRPSWMSDTNHGGVQQASAPPAPSMWASEVAKLKGLALGVLFGTARELLVSSMPTHLAEQIKEVVDSVTKKAGGEPLPSADVTKLCEAVTPRSDQTSELKPMMSQQLNLEAEKGHPATRRW